MLLSSNCCRPPAVAKVQHLAAIPAGPEGNLAARGPQSCPRPNHGGALNLLQSDVVPLEEIAASADWRQEFARMQLEMGSMLTMLVGQQQGFKDQLLEMGRLMQIASGRRETIKEEIMTGIHSISSMRQFVPSLATPRKDDSKDGLDTQRLAEAVNLVEEKMAKMATNCLGSQDASSAAAAGVGIQEEKAEEKMLSMPKESQPVPKQSDSSSSMAESGVKCEVVEQESMPMPMEGMERPASQEARTNVLRSSSLMNITGGKHPDPDEYAKGDMSWRSLAYHIVHHNRFEMFVSGFIIANAMIMGVDVQYEGLQVCYDLDYRGCTAGAKEAWPGAEITLAFFDWMFGILFFLEALLKIVAQGKNYLLPMKHGDGNVGVSYGWGVLWNWLDISCVVAFFFDKIASGIIDARALRLLRLTRLVRLIRLIRKLETLDVLYIMATAIKGMSRILGWAIVLLSLLLMTCALFLSMLLHSSYFEDVKAASLAPADLETYQKLYQYFGTFTRCLLSMFEITLGNWPPVARLLSEEVSEIFIVICVLHKLSIGFAVVGVINGVIMQETFKVAATDDVIMVRQKKRATANNKTKMVSLFMALDSKGTGNLSYEEFAHIAQDPEVKTWLASMEIETDDLPTLFGLIDMDGGGEITIDELVTRVPRIRGAARSIDSLAMRHKLNDMIKLLQDEDAKIDRLSRAGARPALTVDAVSLGGNYSVTPEVHTMKGIKAIGGAK